MKKNVDLIIKNSFDLKFWSHEIWSPDPQSSKACLLKSLQNTILENSYEFTEFDD